MTRLIAILLALLLSPPTALRAYADNPINLRDWLRATSVDWGGTQSGGDIQVANLPTAEARGTPRLTLRLAFPWFAPMCVNWERSLGPHPARLPHRPVVLRKAPDRASPMLRNADRTKRLLKRVVVRARGTSGTPLTIVLKDVRIGCFTTFSPSTVLGAREGDFIFLDYGAIDIRSAPRNMPLAQ